MIIYLLIHDNIQAIKAALSVAFGVLAGMLGGFDNLLRFYVALMSADLALGCIKGIKTKSFSSAIVQWGFLNKIIALAVIVPCVLFDDVLAKEFFLRNIAICWFAICEGASIFENLAILEIPFPDGVKEVFVQARKGFSINFSEIVRQIIGNYALKGDEDAEKNDAEER